MKKAVALLVSGILLSSCVSQKKFTELEGVATKHKKPFGLYYGKIKQL